MALYRLDYLDPTTGRTVRAVPEYSPLARGRDYLGTALAPARRVAMARAEASGEPVGITSITGAGILRRVAVACPNGRVVRSTSFPGHDPRSR